MVNVSKAKERLLAKQAELQQRIGNNQSTERREVEEGQNDNAQLWEVSEIRDDLDDEAVDELKEINQALARLEVGKYGLCQSCGNAIGEARLEAVPYASLCIGCAEDAEE